MAGKNQNSEEKSIRILKIIKRLYQKEILNGTDLANEFNVDIKTIQRDIETLRAYFLEENGAEIKYSKSKIQLYPFAARTKSAHSYLEFSTAYKKSGIDTYKLHYKR